MLEMTVSSHRPTGDEVVQGQPVEGPLQTPWTLHSLEDIFGCRITPTWIVASTSRVLDVATSWAKAMRAEEEEEVLGAAFRCGGWVDGTRGNG